MATYAGAKGRAFGSSREPKVAALPELSDADKEAIAERVRKLQQHLPEAWAFMKALSQEGLIDGMRSLLSVTVFEEVNHGAG